MLLTEAMLFVSRFSKFHEFLWVAMKTVMLWCWHLDFCVMLSSYFWSSHSSTLFSFSGSMECGSMEWKSVPRNCFGWMPLLLNDLVLNTWQPLHTLTLPYHTHHTKLIPFLSHTPYLITSILVTHTTPNYSYSCLLLWLDLTLVQW